MKTFVKQYQISIFFVFTFVLSWFPWYAGIAPEVMTMGRPSRPAAREGTHFPTVAPNLYLTVLDVQVLIAFILIIATKGKLGWTKE